METQSKPKKPFYKKWWVWLIAVLVVIFFAAGSGDEPTRVNEGENNNAPTQEEETFSVGDSVKLGSSVVTVNEVETSQGGQFTNPQPGNKWINLNVTIENTSSSQQYVTTLGQMFLKDSEGNSYQVSVTGRTISSPNTGLDGAVIANSKRTGWVGFEVPEGATDLQFVYNGSMWGGGTITVDL